MEEQFDEEQHMEVQLRLREIYHAMVVDSRGEDPGRDVMTVEVFKEGLKHDPAQAPSGREVADARRIKKEHRAALRKYERAHHKRYPQLDVASARSFWDEFLADVNYIALLNEDNPDYGAPLELRYVLHDAIFDFFHYAYPLLAQDRILARIVGEIREVYEGALRRSDAEKKRWLPHTAAPLTSAENDLQAIEIERRLTGLGLDLTDDAKRLRVLGALITSAHEIRRYQTPEELADLGEETTREGSYRGPSQAAAENVGKTLPDLLEGVPISMEGPLLKGVTPRGERTVMGRVAASNEMRVRRFDPVSLAMRSVDAVLRNERPGELSDEAMMEIAELISRKFEEQRRIDADPVS